ncbi:GspH/FimT family pseudopilin [Modicisalibacter muralis]|nr:GspH/FimT family pseudopilin [Halomonas muralis]
MRGFTLIELLAVIALMAIMATWVVPSFQSLAERNRVSVEVMRLMGALGQARSTAITRREEAVICPTRNQSECDADWKLQLMLFIDKDGTPAERTNDEAILKVWPASEVAALDYSGFGSNRYLRYRANGRPKGQNGTFNLCSFSGNNVSLVLSSHGRLRVAEDEDC